jgi:hypothetical protein
MAQGAAAGPPRFDKTSHRDAPDELSAERSREQFPQCEIYVCIYPLNFVSRPASLTPEVAAA